MYWVGSPTIELVARFHGKRSDVPRGTWAGDVARRRGERGGYWVASGGGVADQGMIELTD